MASDYASAVRAGTMAAGRLHRELDTRALIETQGGSVDVFGGINAITKFIGDSINIHRGFPRAAGGCDGVACDFFQVYALRRRVDFTFGMLLNLIWCINTENHMRAVQPRPVFHAEIGYLLVWF